MNYHVHIKIADYGWILEKCAAEIARRSNNVTYSASDNTHADIQYYINYSAYSRRVAPIEIAFFTHSEKDEVARKRYFDVAAQVDHRVCMSARYANELAEAGFGNLSTFSPGVDLAVYVPKIRVGVVGRTYHTGRKGEALVAEVLDTPGIEWRFTGSGWPGPSTLVADGHMAEFYNDLDYVLVPALYEGGPMCVLEGLACGVPIISSDVGWAFEFPHIPFENGNAESLKSVLRRLVDERLKLRESVTKRTWDAWAQDHLTLFDRLAATERGQVAAAPARRTALLVSHGSEKSTRGGPTMRIANIADAARERGVHLEMARMGQAIPSGADIAHVFNSWPLRSALVELSLAKKAGLSTIYSPIALNLSTIHQYQDEIPNVLANADNVQEVTRRAEIVRAKSAPFDVSSDVPPVQGPNGHFAALRQGVRMADHVIYLSEYERAFLNSIGARPKQWSLIPNGIDANIIAKGVARDFINTFGIDRFVLCIGRIEPRKNQAMMALALRDLDIPFVCIGHVGDAAYFELVKKWSGPNFVHIDRIDDRTLLAGAYKAASCFILTSWAEGAPLAALEAAAAGAPLVLSTMSSEREYFGDYAKYCHPCDIEGMRDAVDQALSETPASRVARGGWACARFDIADHTDRTLQAYDSVRALDRHGVDRGGLAIDLTHLTHQLANGQHRTGVTAVEYSLARSIHSGRSDVVTLAWNSPNRAYVRVDFGDVVDNGGAHIATARNLEGEGRLDVHFRWMDAEPARANEAMEKGPPPSLQKSPADEPMGPRRALISAFKQTLNALPKPVAQLATKSIQLVRPQFNPVVLPQHRLSFGTQPTEAPEVKPLAATCHPERPIGGRRPAYIRLGRGAELTPRTRLLLMGQAWISNDRFLSDLCDLVETSAIDLWAHVPDILYVTDCDAFDSKTRAAYQRRLLKLLSVTDTVITISGQAETEIKAFAQRNGIHIKTRRIWLGPSEELVGATLKPPRTTIHQRYVLYVSSMNNRKRHDFIRDVWRDVQATIGARHGLDDIGLILAGSPQAGHEKWGDPKFQAELAKENIQVIQGASAGEIGWLYKNSLFTVYPARREGWGMPPIESLHFGKACIVSRSVPSAIETDCGGLVKLDATDYYGWVRAIETLLINEKMQGELARAAEAYICPSWTAAASVLMEGLASPVLEDEDREWSSKPTSEMLRSG